MPRRPTVLDPTRAKPPPWFVGSGTGLMMAVLTLCAILIFARAVTTVWLLEDLFAWFAKGAPPPRPQIVEPVVRALPVPRVPRVDPALAGRGLRGNPGMAFGPDAYPMAALTKGEQGRTVAHLQVAPTGAPIACKIVTSSGSAVLDRRTCRIAIARVRFKPARDGRGVPVASRYILPVRWQLPPQ